MELAGNIFNFTRERTFPLETVRERTSRSFDIGDPLWMRRRLYSGSVTDLVTACTVFFVHALNDFLYGALVSNSELEERLERHVAITPRFPIRDLRLLNAHTVGDFFLASLPADSLQIVANRAHERLSIASRYHMSKTVFAVSAIHAYS